MDVHQQDLHDDELYASLGDGSSLQYQTPTRTEIGAEDFVAIFGFEPATHPLTVHLSQLVIPPGCNNLYVCTAHSPTSVLSLLFSDPRLYQCRPFDRVRDGATCSPCSSFFPTRRAQQHQGVPRSRLPERRLPVHGHRHGERKGLAVHAEEKACTSSRRAVWSNV